MYISEQPFKCKKCGHEMKYSPHSGYKASPLTSKGNPVCPKCWDDFIAQQGMEMLCTTDFGRGSEYGNWIKDL